MTASSITIQTRTAELMAFIQALPAAKQESARQLLEQRLAKSGPESEVLYWYPEFNGVVCVCFLRGRMLFSAFSGRKGKPDFTYTFSAVEQLEGHLGRWVAFHNAVAERKALEQAQKAAWQPKLNIGDVFVSQWGYEQTNVDYYQVVAVNGKFVDLRKIDKEVNFASEKHGACRPIPDCFVSDEVLTKKTYQFNTLDPESCVIKLNSYESAFIKKPKLVEGKKVYESDMWTANY